MQRADREITEKSQLLGILTSCEVVRIGLTDGTRAYIVPLHFAHEWTENGLVLYMHGSLTGRKIDMLQKNPLICFEMDRGIQTITANHPCGYSASYESIMGEGVMQLLTELPKRIHGLNLLMTKHGFKGKLSYHSQTLARTAVLAIAVTSLTGKMRPMPM